jgi:hypothetical protein
MVDRRPRLRAALRVAALLFAAAGCRGEVGTALVEDASLIDTGEDVFLDGQSDAPERGCSVLVPTACASPTPRCVPGSDGENRCAAAGTLGDGDACTAAGVACAYGLLCAGVDVEPESTGTICRRICTPGNRCPDGGICPVTLSAGGEFVGLCAGP